MKIKMIVILLISSCLIPIKLYALENPCAGAVPISVTAGLGGVTSSIQTILNHYRDYVHDGNYRLCFPSTEFETVGTLHIPNDSDQEVLIAGLNVTAKATFSSSEHSLLNLDGEQITLYDSAIACIRSDQVGVNISGPNNTVQGTEVSGCSEGIRIEASNTLLGPTDAARYAEEKNIIHDNGIGIHQISGSGNRWGYNVIDNNTTAGIISDSEVGRLAIVPQSESGETYRCARNADGTISSREIKFFGVPQEGTVAIYQSDMINNQGRSLAATCNVNMNGACVINNLNIPFSDSSCGLSIIGEYYINIIFAGMNSTPFMDHASALRGKMPTVEVESPDMPIEAGVRGGGTSSGEDIVASNEEYRAPAGDPVIVPRDDDDDDTGAAVAMDGMGGGNAVDSGISSVAKGCNMFLSGAVNPWPAIMFLPLVVLVALRRRL